MEQAGTISPTPWRVEETWSGLVIYDAQGARVAVLADQFSHHGRRVANAELIVAASTEERDRDAEA